MADWPQYESHKVVKATLIVRVDGKPTPGVPKALFVAPDGVEKRFETTEPAMMNRAEVGWYAVLYEDGYKSCSPSGTFEAGYTLVKL